MQRQPGLRFLRDACDGTLQLQSVRHPLGIKLADGPWRRVVALGDPSRDVRRRFYAGYLFGRHACRGDFDLVDDAEPLSLARGPDDVSDWSASISRILNFEKKGVHELIRVHKDLP